MRRHGAPRTIGKFETPLEAARAQDAYVVLHHLQSENALNFVNDEADDEDGESGSAVSDGNDYQCSVCDTGGDLVCCDGCPKAYHIGCIPALKRDGVPLGDWFCPRCDSDGDGIAKPLNFPDVDGDGSVTGTARVRAVPKKKRKNAASASASTTDAPSDESPFYRTPKYPNQVWVVREARWRATVSRYGAPKTIGMYKAPRAAALAQDAYVRQNDLASENTINFPPDEEGDGGVSASASVEDDADVFFEAARMRASPKKRKKADGATSRFQGVSWNSSNKKWFAQKTVDGKQKHIGIFTNELEAAHAYDSYITMTGIYAALNFPTTRSRNCGTHAAATALPRALPPPALVPTSSPPPPRASSSSQAHVAPAGPEDGGDEFDDDADEEDKEEEDEDDEEEEEEVSDETKTNTMRAEETDRENFLQWLRDEEQDGETEVGGNGTGAEASRGKLCGATKKAASSAHFVPRAPRTRETTAWVMQRFSKTTLVEFIQACGDDELLASLCIKRERLLSKCALKKLKLIQLQCCAIQLIAAWRGGKPEQVLTFKTSQYDGVAWSDSHALSDKPWRASVIVAAKEICIGDFGSAKEARHSYNAYIVVRNLHRLSKFPSTDDSAERTVTFLPHGFSSRALSTKAAPDVNRVIALLQGSKVIVTNVAQGRFRFVFTTYVHSLLIA